MQGNIQDEKNKDAAQGGEQALLMQAIALLQGGRLAEAEAGFRSILKLNRFMQMQFIYPALSPSSAGSMTGLSR